MRREISPLKEVREREKGANTTNAAKQLGKAAGHETYAEMMILALTMRHSVGRPATGMGGGT